MKLTLTGDAADGKLTRPGSHTNIPKLTTLGSLKTSAYREHKALGKPIVEMSSSSSSTFEVIFQ